MVRASDVFPLSEVTFEGLTVMAPHNPDAYLRNQYGDYMQLPPEEQRQENMCSAFFRQDGGKSLQEISSD